MPTQPERKATNRAKPPPPVPDDYQTVRVQADAYDRAYLKDNPSVIRYVRPHLPHELWPADADAPTHCFTVVERCESTYPWPHFHRSILTDPDKETT